MEAFPKTPEVIGIGFAFIATLWVGWKLITRLMDVIEKNATAMDSLSKNIKENTDVTAATKVSTEKMNTAVDNFTSILISALKK